jgi:hypothetical protein
MTTEQIPTLVTPEMEASKGVWGDERTSPPISESDIRKWAIASYWPEPPPRLFWDEQYANTTRFGGIVAPQDFNPFAWPVERPPRVEGGSSQPGRRGMNGGQVETYGVPMRPGDVITARTRLKGWNERTTSLGLTLFTETETEWRNQHGEHVKTRISTGIRY